MHQISDICAAAYFLTIWAVRWENAVSYLGLQLVLTVLYMMYFTGTHQSWLSYYYMVQITNNIVLYTTSFLSRKKNLYYIIMNWKCEFSHDGKKSEVSGLALENHFWLKTNSFILTLQTMTKCITFAKLIKLKYAIRERQGNDIGTWDTSQTVTAGWTEVEQTVSWLPSLGDITTTALTIHTEPDESCVHRRFNPFSGEWRVEGSRWVLPSFTSLWSQNIKMWTLAKLCPASLFLHLPLAQILVLIKTE